jgi:hypothetical protein
MTSIPLLISRYLDGELPDEEISELAKALETDVESVDRLVFTSLIHAQLLNWMDQQSEERDGFIASDDRESLESVDWSATKLPNVESDRKGARGATAFMRGARRHVFSFSTLAAALFIAASVALVAYVISTRPQHVGQLTDATGCRWRNLPADFGVGAFLSSRQDLELLEGRAVITFASGAKLLLEGPTLLHLTSASEIRLVSGRIAAKVPRQAIGFTVTSSLARIVDLGTQFSFALRPEQSFELHVFEGLVELQLDKRFGAAVQKPAYVSAVHAVTFDVNDTDIKAIEFEEGKIMPF